MKNISTSMLRSMDPPEWFIVTTESGSVYQGFKGHAKVNGLDCLFVRKGDDTPWSVAVAVYPNRVPFLEAATAVQAGPSGSVEGFNEAGVRTIRVQPWDLRTGMILANRQGLRSTLIAKIENIGRGYTRPGNFDFGPVPMAGGVS